MYYSNFYLLLLFSLCNSSKIQTISGCFSCDGLGVSAGFFSSNGLSWHPNSGKLFLTDLHTVRSMDINTCK